MTGRTVFSTEAKKRRTSLPAWGHISGSSDSETSSRDATSPTRIASTAVRLIRRFRRHQYQNALLYKVLPLSVWLGTRHDQPSIGNATR